MTRDEKSGIIDELKDKFAANAHYYIADASDLTVAQINDFRRLCFQSGVEYRVAKNTLIRKALEANGVDSTPLVGSKVLKGFSGVIFSQESGKLPAEVLKKFRTTSKIKDKMLLKVASIDGALFFGDNQLDMLSTLKSREELIGDIIGLLQSPAKNVISALSSGGNKLAGIIKTLSERES